MEVSKTRQEVIDQLIEFMIFLSWNDKLGRVLIRRKRINLAINKIEKTKELLKEILCTIHMKNEVLIPMGSLHYEKKIPDELDLGFYFASVTNEVTVIISQINKQPDLTRKNIGERRARNALIQWFSQLQNDPDSIRYDLEEIQEILKNKRGG
ncbi:MAG: hypothetical protein ACQEP3_03310 [Patescibacteria group bacterium]